MVAQEVQRQIYIGWQDVESEVRRIRTAVKLFAAPEYEALGIFDNEELLDQFMKSLVQHYCLES